MKPYLPSIWVLIIAASATAFAPSSPVDTKSSSSRSAVLQAGTDSSENDCGRRTFLRNVLGTVSSSSSALLLLSSFPSSALASSTDASTYAASIERSTNALSESLGHAIIAVDGMNAQAARLGSSPHPAHPVAVLEGMEAQARRLTRDLNDSAALCEEVKSKAYAITINDEKFAQAAGSVAHASSVLEGMVAQSRRLEGALARGGSVDGTDDQIIYMLSVLDGLNAQVRRLDVGETFGVLDELNAKAAMALL